MGGGRALDDETAGSRRVTELERFRDRAEAGKLLAQPLGGYAGRDDVLVLALPRGGVPVAYEVAKALGAPLDVLVVRKLGVPGHEELAMGAIASGGVAVIDELLVKRLGLGQADVERVVAVEREELARREAAYRGDLPPSQLAGKTVILVDDGLATGATMYAAALAARQQDPVKTVVAVPVAAPGRCDEFRGDVDEFVSLLTPRPFQAVGLWYEDFEPPSDDDVRELLARASEWAGPRR